MLGFLLFTLLGQVRADFYDVHFTCIQSRQYLYEDAQAGIGGCLVALRQDWQKLTRVSDLENAFLLFERHDPGYDRSQVIVRAVKVSKEITCGSGFFNRWFLLRLQEREPDFFMKKIVKDCAPWNDAKLFMIFAEGREENLGTRLCTLFPNYKECKPTK